MKQKLTRVFWRAGKLTDNLLGSRRAPKRLVRAEPKLKPLLRSSHHSDITDLQVDSLVDLEANTVHVISLSSCQFQAILSDSDADLSSSGEEVVTPTLEP